MTTLESAPSTKRSGELIWDSVSRSYSKLDLFIRNQFTPYNSAQMNTVKSSITPTMAPRIPPKKISVISSS